eukprot:gene22508-28637_t
MQNLIGYGGKSAIENGLITHYLGDARASWVDVDDVAEVAAIALSHPEKHNGQTIRMGYEALSHSEIAELLSTTLGKPFRVEAQSPDLFLERMLTAGCEIAYMRCVAEHQKRYAAFDIPGAEDTFDDFPAITGHEPVRWKQFIEKHREAFEY